VYTKCGAHTTLLWVYYSDRRRTDILTKLKFIRHRYSPLLASFFSAELVLLVEDHYGRQQNLKNLPLRTIIEKSDYVLVMFCLHLYEGVSASSCLCTRTADHRCRTGQHLPTPKHWLLKMQPPPHWPYQNNNQIYFGLLCYSVAKIIRDLTVHKDCRKSKRQLQDPFQQRPIVSTIEQSFALQHPLVQKPCHQY